MKKWKVLLCLALAAALLAGCAAADEQNVPLTDTQAGGTPAEYTDPIPGRENTVTTMRGRVIQADGDTILLAGGDGDAAQSDTALYYVNLGDLADAPDALEAGDAVELTYDGRIQETWPMAIPAPIRLQTLPEEFDNLCAVYLAALERIWETDIGLNEDITILGVDLSATQLTPAEQAAVALCFGQAHSLDAITGTAEELQAQGYFTPDDPDSAAPRSWHWADGCLFSITEKGESTGDTITFDVEKWRSGTGAYFLIDCTTTRDKTGRWDTALKVGSEAIS